jgi:hypothetical protein
MEKHFESTNVETFSMPKTSFLAPKLTLVAATMPVEVATRIFAIYSPGFCNWATPSAPAPPIPTASLSL